MKGGVWPAPLTFTICTKTASKVSENIDAETSEEISSDTQRDAGIEREVHIPVHGHRYGPLVIVPRRKEIRAIQVCGVKPPGTLIDES